MVEQMNIGVVVNGINTEVEVLKGARDTSFWLVLPFGTKTPLATTNEPDGRSYCYFDVGVGEEYTETRVYSDGTVVTR